MPCPLQKCRCSSGRRAEKVRKTTCTLNRSLHTIFFFVGDGRPRCCWADKRCVCTLRQRPAANSAAHRPPSQLLPVLFVCTQVCLSASQLRNHVPEAAQSGAPMRRPCKLLIPICCYPKSLFPPPQRTRFQRSAIPLSLAFVRVSCAACLDPIACHQRVFCCCSLRLLLLPPPPLCRCSLLMLLPPPLLLAQTVLAPCCVLASPTRHQLLHAIPPLRTQRPPRWHMMCADAGAASHLDGADARLALQSGAATSVTADTFADKTEVRRGWLRRRSAARFASTSGLSMYWRRQTPVALTTSLL